MIIKWRSAPRLPITVLALALTSSVLVTGCKKDGREKIDLSSIHTTAAAETMAPETSPAATEAITIAPETTTAAKKPASTSGGKTGAASAAKNIATTLHTYTSGKVSIEYPSVVNMEDSAKAASIDALMKENALSILNAYGIDDTQDTLTVQCKVLSADRNRITVTYTGTYAAKDAAYPVSLFYSNTIDIDTVDNIGFRRFADPYTMAGYVLSGDCIFYGVTPEVATELMKIKNDTSMEAYTDLFNQADFPFSGTFPESFSYEHEGTIFFSIPVPHALGDYALVAYTPDTK